MICVEELEKIPKANRVYINESGINKYLQNGCLSAMATQYVDDKLPKNNLDSNSRLNDRLASNQANCSPKLSL